MGHTDLCLMWISGYYFNHMVLLRSLQFGAHSLNSLYIDILYLTVDLDLIHIKICSFAASPLGNVSLHKIEEYF